jgi:transglutaminase-like putative cysteine protease
MRARYLFVILFLFVGTYLFSQDPLYSSLTIPKELLKNSSAVIRSNDMVVTMHSSKEMTVVLKRVITVMNKSGNGHVDAYIHYDNNVKIRSLEALVFNASGNQIRKIKKNDFTDVSAVDGGTLYSDYRMKYLSYTPSNYPYTVEFTYDIITNNTAFIRPFKPIEGYFLSVQKSSYTINYPEDITIRKKEKNVEGIDLLKEETSGKIFYMVENLKAMKSEDYSPSFQDLAPKVLIASNEFTYEGVSAKVDDWDSMGKWFNDNLLVGRSDVSEETKKLINELVEGVEDPIEKARIVYNFVQNNTRYISVQVGIGGMQPITAANVDKVKYGDCKGLTNYTKSLLEVVGVKSNYTRLHASPSNQVSVDKEFVSFMGQTNHVILNIPTENQGNIWLECTSQKLPFGFIGDFTDDRDVLVITPEGGRIEHTKKYTTEENTQIIIGSYNVSSTGKIEVDVKISSKGIQYDNKYRLASETQRDLDVQYKKRWRYINDIVINKMDLENDRDSIVFNETIQFSVGSYSRVIGDRMLLPINVLNRSVYIPDRYTSRKLPLKINRGFRDFDEVEITLPKDYKVETLPKPILIENQFGNYQAEIVVKNDMTLVYKRVFVVNDGDFPKEDYEAFRNFYKEVARKDNSKISLIKI